MINRNDPRVKRTRQLIQQTFSELMKEKGFDAVTIQDIAHKATINRATFYAHYTDKYALLDDITALAFENMIPEQILQAKEFTEAVCRQFVELTYNYVIAFYRTCKFDTKSIAAQVDGKVKQILHQTIESVFKKSGAALNTNINAAMISGAIYSAAYCWYDESGNESIEQLKVTVTPFIMNGLRKEI